MSLRVVFMGTPEFSVPALSEIAGQGHEIAACYTRAPKPAGRRGLELTKSPVHEAAERLGIPVFTPKSLRDGDEQARFAALEADVAVVVAYGLILPKAVLDAPRHGCLNLHASLLPRWRGAAPIQRAIMAGDPQTGVMVMQMEEGLDTGPVAMAERISIGENATAGELHDALMRTGADLLVRALAALSRGALNFSPQAADGAVYAHKIGKDETRIDWAIPARDVHNHIRGLSPFPGAWFEADFGKGPERVKVLRSQLAEGTGASGAVLDETLTIACGEGAVRLLQVQRAGRGIAGAQDFLRGAKLAPDSRLV
ncbi:MAG: methionyl-tRNA formyltransferase [Alphaproteobacteria bacterium]|nr:methionyl-tRNA formyltransferase [Alphaproteobacteria bacterium]